MMYNTVDTPLPENSAGNDEEDEEDDEDEEDEEDEEVRMPSNNWL